MRLRNQLLALSVLTLVLPWSGWRLVQELENFLREGEETALLESAQTMAKSMPQAFRSALVSSRGQMLPLRRLGSKPVLDGYKTEWPETDQYLQFESDDHLLALKVLADAWREGDEFVIEFDLPGVSAESIDLDVERNVLTVRAERVTRNGDWEMLASERPRGTFSRQLVLGDNLDLAKIAASYEGGVLRLRVPVAEQAKPRKIQITSGSEPDRAAIDA